MSTRSAQKTPIPLWVVGPRRPADRERRKDPGALNRHEQERTGAAPATFLKRRSSDVPTAHNRMVQLWQ